MAEVYLRRSATTAPVEELPADTTDVEDNSERRNSRRTAKRWWCRRTTVPPGLFIVASVAGVTFWLFCILHEDPLSSLGILEDQSGNAIGGALGPHESLSESYTDAEAPQSGDHTSSIDIGADATELPVSEPQMSDLAFHLRGKLMEATENSTRNEINSSFETLWNLFSDAGSHFAAHEAFFLEAFGHSPPQVANQSFMQKSSSALLKNTSSVQGSFDPGHIARDALSAGRAAAGALLLKLNLTGATDVNVTTALRQHGGNSTVAALLRNSTLATLLRNKGVATLLRNSTVAAMLRRKGAELREKSGQRLQRKRQELLQRGAQVHTGSVALAGAIASGEVHRRVVIVVIVAFLACAVVLQALGAARGELRQVVRAALARSLLAPPASNELVTRPYATWMELAVRVSLDFLNEPANVMLLSIGSLQVLATWSKSDPLRCKKVNLLVLLLCYAHTLVQEVRAQFLAARHDAEWNLAVYMRMSQVGTEEKVLAKDVEVGDILRLSYGDVCPAPCEILYSSHSFVLFNAICETGEDCCTTLVVGNAVLLGFVLAMHDAEVHVRVTETRNGIGSSRTGTNTSVRPLPSKHRHMQRFPEHMNRSLTQANLIALALLFGASVLVCALSYESASTKSGHEDIGGNTESGTRWGHVIGDVSHSEKVLMTHFLSAAVQLNTVIPSMRWVVQFFFYIFIIEAARPEVRVQNWRALLGLEERRVLYSDKTGTLTQVGLSIARLRIVDGGKDLSPLPPHTDINERVRDVHPGDDTCVVWLAVVLFACNDSMPRAPLGAGGGPIEGRRPGTSPEEIAIAEHLEDRIGVAVSSNSLKPGVAPPAREMPRGSSPKMAQINSDVVAMQSEPLILKDVKTGKKLVHAQVSARSDFDPSTGFREATVAFIDDRGQTASEAWAIRQGGADIMAELAGRSSREVELASQDRDRALGWCVARLGADGVRIGAWRYVARASFANPPRLTSAPLVAHCRAANVAVRMLTGDACVAATHIATEIGILERHEHSCMYEPDEASNAFAARIRSWLGVATGRVCVVVPGAVLRKQIEANDGSDTWLGDDRVSAVIYRTRAADKALIVRRTEECGRLLRWQGRSGSACSSCNSGCKPGRRREDPGVCVMMGDASNDAEAISLDGVVGVSLRHGAAPCKLGADFIISEPGALATVRTELHTRALAGARWLLEDVCLLCGLMSSLTLCGIWASGFAFLPRGFLYDDPFDARLMTLFSSSLYLPSSCAAACAVGLPMPSSESSQSVNPRVLRYLIFGAALGSFLGMVGPTDDAARLGRWILVSVASVMLLRHMSTSVGWCSWKMDNSCVVRWPNSESSISDGSAATAALGPPSYVADSLNKAKRIWVRCLALCLFFLLTRVV